MCYNNYELSDARLDFEVRCPNGWIHRPTFNHFVCVLHVSAHAYHFGMHAHMCCVFELVGVHALVAWWQYENDPDSDSETTSPSIGGPEQNNGEQPLFSLPSFMHQGTGAFDPVKFVSLARNYRLTGVCPWVCSSSDSEFSPTHLRR